MQRILFFLALPAFAQTADLVVVNANIHTVNRSQPHAKALAVRGDRILAIGDDVSQFVAKNTVVIDARGATVIPGFIDSHGHVHALGDSLGALNLRGLTSEAVIADRVREAARTRRPGEWILGDAWDQNLWATREFPTAEAISRAAPLNPVALTRVDGHAIWVNRKAMELADINSATPTPQGGKILNGVLLDKAQSLVTSRIPKPTAQQVERSIERALRECARLGLTTVHDAGIDAAEIAAYRTLLREGRMPVRVYAMLAGSDTPLVDEWLKRGPETSPWLTIRSIKVYADGALGSRGAALLQPYSDDPSNKGLLITSQNAIQSIASRALASGFQVNTHAIGDAANRATLDAYGAVLKGFNDHRFRVEHAQVVAPDDFAKFRRYSVIASMQPTHAVSDMPWAPRRLGPVRVHGAYAWRTFLQLGVHLASGSDFPVESPNPIPGFYAAVNGPIASQRMSPEEALRSWTIEGAYAAFEERSKGSLETGKLADFAMLSDDLLTAPGSRVTMTVAGGKIVFRQ